MPHLVITGASAGASAFNFTSATFGYRSLMMRSSVGVSCLQGPHQSA